MTDFPLRKGPSGPEAGTGTGLPPIVLPDDEGAVLVVDGGSAAWGSLGASRIVPGAGDTVLVTVDTGDAAIWAKIIDANIQSGADINVAKLLGGTEGQVLTTNESNLPVWADPVAAPLQPIHYQFWVGLTTAFQTPTGAIDRPFDTLEDALAAGNATPSGSIIDYFLAGDDYTGGVMVLATGRTHRPVSMCGGTSLSIISLTCSEGESGRTQLDMVDCFAPSGIVLVGTGGDGVINAFWGYNTGVSGISVIDVSALTAGTVTVSTINGRIDNIYDPLPAVTLVRCRNTDIGIIDAAFANLDVSGGRITGPVSIFQITDVVDCVIGRGAELTMFFSVTATSAGSVGGFSSCEFNGPVQFTGPVGSFTSDIDSAENFWRHGGGLAGGATSNFTAQGDEGKALKVVDGLPHWTASPTIGQNDCTTSGPNATALGDSSQATNVNAFACNSSLATGDNSFAKGRQSEASAGLGDASGLRAKALRANQRAHGVGLFGFGNDQYSRIPLSKSIATNTTVALEDAEGQKLIVCEANHCYAMTIRLAACSDETDPSASIMIEQIVLVQADSTSAASVLATTTRTVDPGGTLITMAVVAVTGGVELRVTVPVTLVETMRCMATVEWSEVA